MYALLLLFQYVRESGKFKKMNKDGINHRGTEDTELKRKWISEL